MKQTTLDKLVHLSVASGTTPGEFARMLCSPPHNLTPPEATPLMKEYARQMAAFGPVKKAPSLPKPAPAKVTVASHSGATGELLSPPVHPAYRTASYDGLPAEPAAPRLSIINRSAVKQYALKVSKEKRAGKFKRVSAEFLNSVEANLEASIRGLVGKPPSDEDVTPDAEADWFINGRTLRVAEDKLNELARQIVLGKVRRHPAIGVTLK